MGAFVIPKSGGLQAPAAKLPTSSALSSTSEVWTSSSVGASGGGNNGNGVLTAAPFDVAAALTVLGLACDITAAGAGGTPLVRLGLYASDTSGFPGALLLDAGTVDAASTGVKILSASLALQPGRYWVAGVAQGATITQPQPRCHTGIGLSVPAESAAAALGTNFGGVRRSTADVTGALPATFGVAAGGPFISGVTTPIRVAVRTA